MSLEGVLVTLLVLSVGVGALLVIERRFGVVEQRLLWLGFSAHVICALTVVWVTSDVLGGGDLLAYHKTGLRLVRALRADFWEVFPDVVRVLFHARIPLPVPIHGEGSATGAMSCLTTLLLLVLGDSIYPACMVVSLGAFFSRVALYSAFRRALQPQDPRWLLAACVLLPSLTFWCSGLLKEAFAFIGLGTAFWALQSLTSRGWSWSVVLVGVCGVVLTGVVKGYLLMPFGVGLAAWLYLSQRRKGTGPRSTFAFVIAAGLAAIAIVVGGLVFPRYALAGLAEETLAMQAIGQRISGGSNIVLMDPGAVAGRGLGAQLPYMPLALVTALFRPFLFEAKNGQMLLNALETLLFTVGFVLALARNGIRRNLRTLQNAPVLGLCVGFVLAGALGIGLTTANLGSLSRYRAPLMPFFGVLLVMLTRREPAPQPIHERSSVFRIRQLRSP